jgi:broad specificity phosphatase PhoE
MLFGGTSFLKTILIERETAFGAEGHLVVNGRGDPAPAANRIEGMLRPLKQLLLVRHGESASNAGLVTEGHGTYPLTELGHKQAKRFADIWPWLPEFIVHSRYTRARQTAAPFLDRYRDVPREEWGNVHEFTLLCPDRYNGTTFDERSPHVKAYWERSDPMFCDGPGAETFTEFIARVKQLFQDTAYMRENTIVVFTHGTFMQAALYSLLAGAPESPKDMAAFHRFTAGFPVPNLGVMMFHNNEEEGIWSAGRMLTDLV